MTYCARTLQLGQDFQGAAGAVHLESVVCFKMGVSRAGGVLEE